MKLTGQVFIMRRNRGHGEGEGPQYDSDNYLSCGQGILSVLKSTFTFIHILIKQIINELRYKVTRSLLLEKLFES